MRNTLLAFAVATGLVFIAGARAADDQDAARAQPAKIGEKAPAFSAADQDGRQISLGDYRDKIIVLEWINPGCPYVARHAKEQTMKKLAEKYKDKDVVWLGVMTAEGVKAEAARGWAKTADVSYPILLDGSKDVARAYGAKATPHMFVIDKSGKLAYSGAIDNDPEAQKPAGERINFVARALESLLEGKSVAVPETRAYGCAVHYE